MVYDYLRVSPLAVTYGRRRREDAMPGPDYEALSLLTVSEVAQMFRCSPLKVRRLADAGDLERVKLGSLVRITPESVAAYKQRLRDQAAGDGGPLG
jgi:excisionase family DNA binding protein